MPVGEAGSDRCPVKLAGPVLVEIQAQTGIAPAPPTIELREPLPKCVRGGVLHDRIHRSADPQAPRIDAVRSVLGLLAVVLQKGPADLFHEIPALLAELLVAPVANCAERSCGRRTPGGLCDVPVVVHLAQDVVAAVESLLGGPDRIVIGWRLGEDREIGCFRQGQVGHVLVEIGAACRLHAVGVPAEEDGIQVDL